ncbi:hypothetical protein ACN47E_001352 [Coniothyrium glycines]
MLSSSQGARSAPASKSTSLICTPSTGPMAKARDEHVEDLTCANPSSRHRVTRPPGSRGTRTSTASPTRPSVASTYKPSSSVPSTWRIRPGIVVTKSFDSQGQGVIQDVYIPKEQKTSLHEPRIGLLEKMMGWGSTQSDGEKQARTVRKARRQVRQVWGEKD